LNSFRLDGLRDLDAGYRFINFSGLLPDDEDYEKKVRLLSNLLSSKLRLPVEPFRNGDGRHLAVAAPLEQLKTLEVPGQIPLNPEIAFLELDASFHEIGFQSRDGVAHKLAIKSVLWSIERALSSWTSGWWRYGGRFVRRTPDESLSTDEILVMPAFYFGVVAGSNGIPELVIDPSVCYVERKSVFQKYGRNIPARIRGRRYLHCYGDDWYKIDAMGVSGPANKEMMVDPISGRPISIFDRAIARWGNQGLTRIANLVPDAPTIAYKTVGLESRRALSDLLYCLPGVESEDEGEEGSPHQQSIFSAAVRGRRTEEIIAGISSELTLFGRRMQPANLLQPVRPSTMQTFPTPRLRFAGDQEVSISLENAGRDRMDALRGLGPAVGTAFHDQQLIVIPDTLPEAVRSDFKRRFSVQVHDLYGQPYTPELLTYDDAKSRQLREKSRAIEKQLQTRTGYALLVLPSQDARRQSRLHDYLKRKFWRTLQTQCASATRILGFYQRVDKNGEEKWVVRQGKEGKYRSYLQLLALGYLMVNRKWLWKLAEGTMKHDVHVGIDVYKGVTVFTFIYGDADLITFHVSKATRPEKLSASHVKQILIENLGPDLTQLCLKPRSIVFHRDGQIFDSEIRGINDAITYLQNPQMDVLPTDLRWAIVEIHKNSSTRPRVYRRAGQLFQNPAMGTAVRLGKNEVAVLTTGEPMLRRGTARPLLVELIVGDLDVMEIAHDLYSLSHLTFTAPNSCLRLPFTIALADHILRESTPGKEDELWEDEMKMIASIATV
jgi:hypothetical protein